MATATQPWVIIKRYHNDREYQLDAIKQANKGCFVQAVTSEQPRAGCLRIILTGGLGALIWKPKPQLVVTYSQTSHKPLASK